MEYNNKERFSYFLLKRNVPLYVKDKEALRMISDYPSFEINKEVFEDELNKFINDNSINDRKYIIIDTDKINKDVQKNIIPIIKDRSYMTYTIPDNCIFIVTGNKDNIDNGLYSLLVVLDV